MALPVGLTYDYTYMPDVWRGRNNFENQHHQRFVGDQRVTLSFDPTLPEGVTPPFGPGAPAIFHGPWPRKFLEQFFPALSAAHLFQRPATGYTDAQWATGTVNENFPRAVQHLKPNVFAPIEEYLNQDDLSFFRWRDPAIAPANMGVDMRDSWVLADFLQSHAIKNAIGDHYFNNLETPDDSPARAKGKHYYLDRPIIEYCFEHQLWNTQFGRTVIYIIRKEIMSPRRGIDVQTRDDQVLPLFLENILGVVAQDNQRLADYFELLRMIMVGIVRPIDEPEFQGDSVGHFCGIIHHHPGEYRCTEFGEGSPDLRDYHDSISSPPYPEEV